MIDAASVDAGLLWVEARIRALAAELGRPVDAFEWPRARPAAGPFALRIWRGGQFRIIEFAREELLEVEGDPEVQRRPGERMGEVLLGSQPRA